MSWVSWLALFLSVVSLTMATRTYLRAKRQQRLAEEQRARVEAALADWLKNRDEWT